MRAWGSACDPGDAVCFSGKCVKARSHNALLTLGIKAIMRNILQLTTFREVLGQCLAST